MTKVCFKCGKRQPQEAFYRHSGMTDGLLGKCKECTKADVRDNYRRNKEQIQVYEKLRQQDPERRARKRAYLRNHNARHPERSAARIAVNNAVRDGRLQKAPCVVCGNAKSEGHHIDYSRPLDVIWLCRHHHRMAEGRLVTSDG